MATTMASAGPTAGTLAAGASVPSTATTTLLKDDKAPITITRRIQVRIQGSMADFAQDGQGSATWKCMEGQEPVVWGLQVRMCCCLVYTPCLSLNACLVQGSGYSHNTSFGKDMASASCSIHALGSAIIHRAVLLEHKSTFKVPLGVTINCLPSNEMTSTGEGYCYTVLPESSNKTPLTLYEHSEDSAESMKWRKEYSKYNKANLEKTGTMEVADFDYIFVHETHPVIALLRANKDLLGCDIDKQQKIDNAWFKVDKKTFQTSCNTLRNKVLSKVDTKNLNDFSVELHRVGTRDWLDLGAGEDALVTFQTPANATKEDINTLEAKHMERFCEQKHSYFARLEITFEVQPV